MVSCIVVCGGRSTRMGRDKSFLTLGGVTFLDHVVKAATSLSDDVVLTVGSLAQKTALEGATGLPIYVDEEEGVGPLMGILTGLKNIKHDYAAVFAIDNPLVSTDLMRHLVDLRQGHDVVIPQDRGHLEPMQAVYHKDTMIKAAEAALGRGERGVYQAARSMEDLVLVDVEDLRSFDPHLLTFKSINTLEDLEEVQRMAEAGA